MSYKIISEAVVGKEPKRFRPKGRLHHNIEIYIHSEDQSDLDNISLVQYKLHSSFKDNIRISEDRRSNFRISIWTYGYFRIQAKILFKDESVKKIQGFVKW